MILNSHIKKNNIKTLRTCTCQYWPSHPSFHFSHARSFVGPAIDLGYALYMGATPLHPKPVWRYLAFFFDHKPQFKEHARFYTTRVFT
jgi:hypothetical protein